MSAGLCAVIDAFHFEIDAQAILEQVPNMSPLLLL